MFHSKSDQNIFSRISQVIKNIYFSFIYFNFLFLHGKKIHQVHKCLKIPKPKNTNPIITLIYNKATYRSDFHECRVFKNIDEKAFKLM